MIQLQQSSCLASQGFPTCMTVSRSFPQDLGTNGQANADLHFKAELDLMGAVCFPMSVHFCHGIFTHFCFSGVPDLGLECNAWS